MKIYNYTIKQGNKIYLVSDLTFLKLKFDLQHQITTATEQNDLITILVNEVYTLI